MILARLAPFHSGRLGRLIAMGPSTRPGTATAMDFISLDEFINLDKLATRSVVKEVGVGAVGNFIF